MALGMHTGLATHHKVPKRAISRLIAHFYPFEYSYVGYVHHQCKPGCVLSHPVLFLTLHLMHAVGDAHRRCAKPKVNAEKHEIFTILEGFWTI